MSVTVDPNAANALANSAPTAPAPRIAMDRGTSGSRSAPALSRTRSLSMTTPGRLRGREPVATRMCRASRLTSEPSVAATRTWVGVTNRPAPGNRAMPFLRIRNSIPRKFAVTTRSIRRRTWP